MAELTRTLAVPTTSTPGASVDCTNMKPDGRTLVYTGTAGDDVEVQVSNNNTNWAPLFVLKGPADIKTSNQHRFKYARLNRPEGSTAGVCVMVGAEEITAVGPAGPPTLGAIPVGGTCTTTDATATVVCSFTPGGDGGFSVFGHLVGVKDDETIYTAIVSATWKKVSGTLSLVGVTPISEQTSSLDPGTPTGAAASGVAQLKVVGIASTTIHWTFSGVLTPVDAF